MNQNSHDCGCNDYSLLTAKTGVAKLSAANPNLDGTGTTASVITGGANGTIIKSIIIKAAQPTLTGMVRLFITNAAATITTLYREIPISTNPVLSSTPTPKLILPMREVDLMEGLQLEANAVLIASTQNAEAINVIAEAFDYAYPGTLPDSCCNYKQTQTITGNGIISVANTALDGSGTLETVFTSPAPATSNGGKVKSISIAALQSTHEGMVRFFINKIGRTPALFMEVLVPETTQSAYQPSFKQVLKEDFCIEGDFTISASTEIAESFAITVEGESWSYPIS